MPIGDRLPIWWTPSRRLLAAILVSLLLLSTAMTVAGESPHLEPKEVTSPAAGDTIISVQGDNVLRKGNATKPGRLVSVGPTGRVEWVRHQTDLPISWFYDVDPLPGGDLLLVGTHAHKQTTVMRLDGSTRAIEWSETLDLWDTHDVTLTARGNLLIANMRNTTDGVSRDRLYVYNRTTDEVIWEWTFANHYANDTDDGIAADDWSHVNDVDVIAPGLYMASPRNFDQVIVIDRETKRIAMRLGADDAKEILDEQHNPAYLQGRNGTPTILVADSENDRVVEYACNRSDPTHPLDGDLRPNCDWTLTWEVGVDQLEWPRDADRLPNGNTLITDSLNHRVIEVTPSGEIVWAFSAPWLPFDAERPVHGREAGGPTMRELNATGSYRLSENATTSKSGPGPDLPERIGRLASGLPGGGAIEWLTERYEGVAPWIRPAWMPADAFALFVLALSIGVAWLGVETATTRFGRGRPEKR